MQDRLWAGMELKLENAKLHCRRTCIVLLAAASLMSSPPVWSQNATDWWQAGGRPAVLRLRDCIAAYADHKVPERSRRKTWRVADRRDRGGLPLSIFGLIQLFAQHIDAKEIELQLRKITDTTLLPALKGKRGSTAYRNESPMLPLPDPVLTRSIVIPDNAGDRRALSVQFTPIAAPRLSSARSGWPFVAPNTIPSIRDRKVPELSRRLPNLSLVTR